MKNQLGMGRRMLSVKEGVEGDEEGMKRNECRSRETRGSTRVILFFP